ncbi:hypothetical protein UA1_02941, partial [Enterococcus faecalis EnGen0234]
FYYVDDKGQTMLKLVKRILNPLRGKDL